jgi:uncharacterized protein YutE (UPF0331/DUF86 family)
MYNVNTEQIEIRLAFLTTVVKALRLLNDKTSEESLLHRFALERAMHVAAESITDIGNYMIDGFVMRDAASYEDIIEILFGEGVFPHDVYDVISPLVLFRKPLVQNYYHINHDDLTNLSQQLPDGLDRFADCIVQYLSNEL